MLLNEIGLDPGIDQCSAFSLLRQLEKEKKQVLSFTSFCGGLPAPEASDVLLGYKFSWSPRVVLNMHQDRPRSVLIVCLSYSH